MSESKVFTAGAHPKTARFFDSAHHEQAITAAADMLLHSCDSKNHHLPVLAAVVGASASGKTSHFAPWLSRTLDNAPVIAEDEYCLGNSRSPWSNGRPGLHTRAAYDPPLLRHHLEQLKEGQSVEVPHYSYTERERQAGTRTVQAMGTIILEGCYLLHPATNDIFDARVFIQTDEHSRFVRRLLRPRRSSAQTDAARLEEYCEAVYDSYFTETLPYADNADIIIDNPYHPGEADGRTHFLDNLVPEAQPAGADCQEYRHPAMAQTESLAVVTLDGLQTLLYQPDRDQPQGVAFRVLESDYNLDLTRIGYDLQ